jgi:hypothetical protein
MTAKERADFIVLEKLQTLMSDTHHINADDPI